MRILHPTDFSRTAEKALSLARDLRQRATGELHVVHVQQRFGGPGGRGFLQPQLDNINPELTKRLDEERRLEVEQIHEMLRHLASPDGTTELRWGDPLRELLDLAPDFDLIVMGAHGANRLDNFFLGGIAGRFVRRSRAPVMTVRDEATAVRVQRILVATDFGEASRRAWDLCRTWHRFGIRLVVAHVLDDARVQDDAAYTSTVTDALDRLAGDVAERYVLREGNAAEQLPRIAQEVGADVIAIGLRRHTSALGLLLGSRADALIRSSAIPILSVPAVID